MGLRCFVRLVGLENWSIVADGGREEDEVEEVLAGGRAGEVG